MQSGIRDNYRHGRVADFLFEKIREGSELSVVSAYFTIYAFEALKEELLAIRHMRFLYGEPSFMSSVDPGDSEAREYRIRNGALSLGNVLHQKSVARECERWLESKVDVKSVRRSNLMHGKMYHIDNGGVTSAIIGSSNLTTRGLGLSAVSNIELNLVIDSDRDRADLKAWFDTIWDDEELVEDVKQKVIGYLQKLYRDNPPEFIYYKTLFHIFEQYLRDGAESRGLVETPHFLDSEIWKALFTFQRDGVRGATNRILMHNGCILADSVGLGKTYEALAIIKYFELRNERVLVLCPKKLRDNWTVYQAQNNSDLNPFVKDRFTYTVLCHTDLSRDQGMSGDVNLANLNWDGYDLIVIDESHNFRNNAAGARDENGNLIRKTRYQRLMEDVLQAGGRTKVLLLSATPVNNDLADLRNQLYLITEGDDAAFARTLNMPSLKDALGVAQRQFAEWAKHRAERERSVAELLEGLNSAFFQLLDALTIARSRRHLKDYYADTLAELGPFPDRLPPVSKAPQIDTKDYFPSYDRVNDEILEYKLSLFAPTRYVLEPFRAKYSAERVRNFTQENRERFLIGMMKTNFLKRLESSVHSFEVTMNRTVAKIEALEEKLREFRKRHGSDEALGVDDVTIAEPDDDETADIFQAGAKLRFRLSEMDIDQWLADLAQDRKQLHRLALSAHDITPERDAKLHELMKLLRDKVEKPTTDRDGRPNRKTLVFTAFADTAAYLYSALEPWAREKLGVHIALVSGGEGGNKTTFGSADFTQILINFAPRAKKRARMRSMPQEGEIDVLIATDCISEGQNLQDCDWLINYDIHWNPVRLIQRFGRIDRIGSRNAAIQLINFWPTEDLNRYINLKSRVEARMALVDITATSQDNILDPDALADVVQQDLAYRDRQLLRLQHEVLDIEDVSESISLTEFSLDDFRMELIHFLEGNRELLESAPLGLYAVAAPPSERTAIRPGVIFCLRQKGDVRGVEAVNPLKPYFLVYIRDEGDVRYNFVHPKQILESYRALCKGKSAADEALCRLFDRDTDDGKDMSRYTALLGRAMDAITAAFRKREARQLTLSRDAVLLDEGKQAHGADDFELVTWLVIKEREE